MKARDIAKQYGFDQRHFESFVNKQTEVRVRGFNFDVIDDNDVPRIVENYRKALKYDDDLNKATTQLDAETAEEKRQRELAIRSIPVTTGDLHQAYEIIGPVYFQISNKGLFGSALTDYKQKYQSLLNDMKKQGTMSERRNDWGFLYGEWSVGQNDFEAAFYIATEEIKRRAAMLGADAVICMRQDIDMDTNGFAFFYLQMYGTAVKLL